MYTRFRSVLLYGISATTRPRTGWEGYLELNIGLGECCGVYCLLELSRCFVFKSILCCESMKVDR